LRPRRLGLPTLVVLLALASAVLSACGEDDSPAPQNDGAAAGGDKVPEAREALAAAEEPVQFEAAGAPIELGDEMKGKTLFFMANGLEFPFSQGVLNGVRDAAKVVGAEVVVTDSAGSVSKASKLIDQAIGRAADVILLMGLPDSALDAPIRAAKEAGIPVIPFATQDQKPLTQEQKDRGVSAIVSFSYTGAGEAAADFMVADSDGDVNAVVFDVPDIGAAEPEKTGFINRLKELCPDCKVTEVKSPLAQWQSGLPGQVTSAIQRDPDVNYLFGLFDGMVFTMIPAVNRANAQDRVKVVTYNASEPLLKDLKADTPPMGANIGGSTEWMGWALVDQTARLVLGEPPVDDPKIPNRSFTQRNTKDLDIAGGQEELFGADFRAGYTELWGR
jgi:ribose transport system substrate-binding protein